MIRKSVLWHLFLRTVGSLLLLIIFSFLTSRAIPGDPIRRMTHTGEQRFGVSEENRSKSAALLYEKLGLNLPLFYISISTPAIPDSFRYLPEDRFRKLLLRTTYWSGQPDSSFAFCKLYLSNVSGNFAISDPDDPTTWFDETAIQGKADEELLIKLKSKWAFLKKESRQYAWKRYLPVIKWNVRNQFHEWFFGGHTRLTSDNRRSGLIHFDLGTSWVRGLKVTDAIKYPFVFTLIQTVLVLFLTFLLAIAFGTLLIRYREKKWTALVRSLFVLLYALPLFWIGTLFLFFFSNPNWINLFPSAGPLLVTDAGWMSWLTSLLSQCRHLVLPVLVLSYSTVVYLSQLIYELLTEELQRPYITTLRAKGCSENKVIRHALRNILSPVLLSLMSVFPVLISGAVVIDFLFSIHGIGAVLAQACDQRDFPVVAGVLLLTGAVTILSFYLTELFTHFTDPRISQHEA